MGTEKGKGGKLKEKKTTEIVLPGSLTGGNRAGKRNFRGRKKT